MIKRTVVVVYGCPECKASGTKASIKAAKADSALIPHSYASEGIVAHSIYQKFANAVPLKRQEKDWQQMGVICLLQKSGRRSLDDLNG